MQNEFEPELPHNLEAEQSVLGSILLIKIFAKVEDLISEEHFFSSDHQRIFRAMRTLAEDGEPVDVTTLSARLQERNELAQIGGVSYLASLAGSVPATENLETYIEIVKERYLHRQTILELKRQLAEAWKAESPETVIGDMQVTATILSDQAVKSKEFRTIQDVALEAFERIEQRYENRSDGGVTGISSGYPDFDKMTSGFQNSDLVIIAARPSVGKTAFALNVCQHAAIREGRTVAIFSLEMSAGQLVQRMMSSEKHIHSTRLRTGYLESDDWERLTMAVGSLSESKIFIDDSPVLTAQEIAGKCRRLKKNIGLDLVVIDYLQLIIGRNRRENRQQEVSEISRTLKAIARELEVPVIALSQLSRGVEQRQDKRLLMSDLRDSGSIEQDADIVAFLYRDDYYNKDSEKKNIIEVIISKQRNGPVGTVELAFLKNYSKFVSLDRSDHERQESASGYKKPDMYRRYSS